MSRKKNILFLTDNFPPEVNAPATRTYEHAKVWVSKGVNVTIITTAPNFPLGKLYKGYSNKFFQTEIMDGIRVIRVWTYITANEGFFRRTMDYLSFALMSFIVGCFIKTDVILATSPQFFTAVAGRCLAFVRRKPWIMEVRDLWPESIVSVGIMKKNIAYHILENIELHLYNSARKIVVVTDSFKKQIALRGINENKIVVHKNGVMIDDFKRLYKKAELSKSIPNLQDKKIIAYVGTHGLAHGLDFIITSLKVIEVSLPHLHFVFIGDGAEKENLIKLSSAHGLKNITFLNSMPKVELVNYYSIIDVALVNLKKSDTFKSVIPSKIFEAAAFKKPILLGLQGEAQQLVDDFGAGLCFEPENERDFLLKCEQIFQAEIYDRLCLGCGKLANEFNREKIADSMLSSIYELL
jgi:glycosyltransferase involved in cell wall biosynthesis